MIKLHWTITYNLAYLIYFLDRPLIFPYFTMHDTSPFILSDPKNEVHIQYLAPPHYPSLSLSLSLSTSESTGVGPTASFAHVCLSGPAFNLALHCAHWVGLTPFMRSAIRGLEGISFHRLFSAYVRTCQGYVVMTCYDMLRQLFGCSFSKVRQNRNKMAQTRVCA